MGIVFCLKKTKVFCKKLEEVKFFNKIGAMTYFILLTDSRLVRIMNELQRFPPAVRRWKLGDNGELRIPISDC